MAKFSRKRERIEDRFQDLFKYVEKTSYEEIKGDKVKPLKDVFKSFRDENNKSISRGTYAEE